MSDLPSEFSTSARMATAVSACWRVTTSGGARRTDRSPHVSTSSPRSKHACSRATAASWSGRSMPTIRPAAANLVGSPGGRAASRQGRRAGTSPTAAALAASSDSTRSSVASGGGAGDRVAAERRAVTAGLPVHDLPPGDDAGQRQAAGEALADAHDVGLDAVVLGRPHPCRCGRLPTAPRRARGGCRARRTAGADRPATRRAARRSRPRPGSARRRSRRRRTGR